MNLRYLHYLLLFPILVGCGGRLQPVVSVSTSQNQRTETFSAPTIKVYIENSGSMDGYVKGATDFENAVYSYLSDIQLADLGEKDSASHKNRLELNYINCKVLEYKSDIEEFIKKLEPATFRQRGGNRGTSDMADIIDKILEREGINDVSIFVSDCIFSPGKKYRIQDNADEYLVSQQIGIKNHIVEKLIENPDFAIVVMQLKSEFDGYYYNKFDERTYIKADRPFYVWLLGNRLVLKQMMDVVDVDQIKGSGVQNMYMLSRMDGDLDYGIMLQQCIGHLSPDKSSPQTTVTDVKVDKKGGKSNFQIAVGVDFSNCLLEDSYLMNVDNYSISNKAYNLEIVRNNNQNSSYTHILKLKLNQPIISKGSIKVTLLNRVPSWIEKYTDFEGLDIYAENAMEKTYGLKYLMDGLYDAYSNENQYGIITINIK